MIQLVSVVKYEFVTKYGIDEILKPFVQDLSVLEFSSTCTCMYIVLCITNVHHSFTRVLFSIHKTSIIGRCQI